MAYSPMYTVCYCLWGSACITRSQPVAIRVGCSRKGFFSGPLCKHMLLILIKSTTSMLKHKLVSSTHEPVTMPPEAEGLRAYLLYFERVILEQLMQASTMKYMYSMFLTSL